MFKRVILWMLVGLALGNALFAWVGMRVSEWYADPGAATPISCAPAIKHAFDQLITWELAGMGVGAVLFLILGILWERRHKKDAGQAAKPSAPPAR